MLGACPTSLDSVRIQPLRDDRSGGRLFSTLPHQPPPRRNGEPTGGFIHRDIYMRHYEICFIVHPDQSEQVPAMIERYRATVDLEERQDSPARGLGPAPAHFPDLQGAQGALRAHEYRVRCGDARRARALVQVQRRGAPASRGEDGSRLDDALADDEGREGEIGARGRSAQGRGAQVPKRSSPPSRRALERCATRTRLPFPERWSSSTRCGAPLAGSRC